MHVGHTITLVCARTYIQHTLTETRPTTHTALTSSYSWPQTGIYERGLTDRKGSCHTDAPCVPPPCDGGHRRVHRIPCCTRSHDPAYPRQLHRDLCLCEDGSCSRRARAVREVVGVSASLCEKTSRVNTSSTADAHTHTTPWVTPNLSVPYTKQRLASIDVRPRHGHRRRASALKSSGARGGHTIPPLRGACIPLCEYHNLPHTRRAQMNHVVLSPHMVTRRLQQRGTPSHSADLSAKSCMHEQQDSTPKRSWVCLGRVSSTMHVPPFNNGHNTLSCNTRLSHACTACPRVADCQHRMYKTMITLRHHDERAQHGQAGPHACTLSRAPSNPQPPLLVCECGCRRSVATKRTMATPVFSLCSFLFCVANVSLISPPC